VVDPWLFLKAFVRDPSGIGAVAPSSRFLAEAMVGAAGIEAGHTIVELGAGTGPMTEVLYEHHPDCAMLVLEPDPALAARCRARVPKADVVEALAQDLPSLTAARGWSAVDRVVSSLPFASFPEPLQQAVFSAIADVIAPDGRFVTFTYAHSPTLPAGRRARRMLEDRFARVRTTPIVWRNLPPAFVYVCDVGP